MHRSPRPRPAAGPAFAIALGAPSPAIAAFPAPRGRVRSSAWAPALAFALAVSAAAPSAPALSAAVPAFPGAQGFGAGAAGPRGGDASVYLVTHLGDSGPGSFRDAVGEPGRYVVFRVGGIIRISDRIVVKPRVYIAGQTAPGEGVTIYGNGVSYTHADDSITRHVRFRMGLGGDKGKDAVSLADGERMIFDHVSVSWGRDENFSINGKARDITIQDSIIAMGLQTHSCGGLVQTDGGVSILRCLYIDNHTRNPKVKGKNEFVNNVVYNWGGGGAYILGDSAGPSHVNVLNNYFIDGPQTRVGAFTRGNLNFNIHAAGNYQDDNRNGILDGAELPRSAYGEVAWRELPHDYPTRAGLLGAADAAAHVALHAGATVPARDRVDRRYIAELLSHGTLGQIPNNENDEPIGGPGPVAGGPAPLDTDGDGMPDDWELANGLDPKRADHNADRDGDGYPNIEDYFNWLVGLDTGA